MWKYWRKVFKKKLLKPLLFLLRKKKFGKKKKKWRFFSGKRKLNIRNLAIGCLLLVLALVILFYSPAYFQPVSKSPIRINTSLYKSNLSDDIPVKISIPAVEINNLNVVKARVVNGYWELSDSSASYGMGSGHPGTPGNTVIFAHARTGLFYNLKNIQAGNVIYIYTKDRIYIYKVTNITAVYPSETKVIEPTKTDTLTLYTCTGFYDEKRLVVIATPAKTASFNLKSR